MSASEVANRSADSARPHAHVEAPGPDVLDRRAAWTTIAVAAAAMVGTFPGRTQGLGVITEQLLADLQLTKVQYGHINLWATLIGAVACLPTGRALDRYGMRAVLCATALLLGAIVIGMSQVAGYAALFVFVTLTRAVGQGALSVVSIAIVGKSFDRRLVWPMATYALLGTVGFVLAFVLVMPAVTEFGWRAAWSGVGVLLIVGLAPSAWLLARKLPHNSGDDLHADDREGFTLGQALATPAFWVFAVAVSLFGLASSGLGLYNEAVLAERGFDRKTFELTMALSAPFALVGQGLCGWWARRASYQRLTTLAMGVYAAALACLAQVATMPELIVSCALLGVSGGMIMVIFFAVWPRLFGRRELGRIQGAAQMLTVLASAVGPLLFAQYWELTGSYRPVLYATAGAVILVGIAAMFVASPTPTNENP